MDLPQGLRGFARRSYVSYGRAGRRLSAWLWRTLPRSWRRPFEVVDSFDTWAYLSDLTDDVTQVLDSKAIEYLVLADPLLPRPQIVIRRTQASQFQRVLAADARTAKWWLAPSRGGPIGRAVPARRRRRLALGCTGLVVTRNLVTANGLPLTHSELGVLVEFWTELTEPTGTAGGGEHPPGTLVSPKPNGILDTVGTTLWRGAQETDHRLPATPPHLLVVTEPVDLVYTWVDGNDPAWRARKTAAQGVELGEGFASDAAMDVRFEHRDELKYSLRSVQMYANWVNRVWVVTDRQAPDWLRQDERLRIVDHTEIFADATALPVFNSHAIESQLHHVPGLADRYLYLNDDMLFGAPVRPEHFFHANGISKFFTSLALIDLGDHTRDDIAVTAAAKNNRDLIEAEFGRTITNKLWHTPQPQSRPLLAEFEASHPELFDAVMRSQFRHSHDHSLPSSLSQYYAFAVGRAVTDKVTYGYLDLAGPRAEVELERWLKGRDQQCMCLNDAGDDEPAVRRARDAALRDFFETYFPLPSSWER